MVGLHVAAKRYLVAMNSGYLDLLSEVSLKSFRVKGEVMNEAEIVGFKADPHAHDALDLRRTDDSTKVFGISIACLDAWLPVLCEVVKRR